MVEHRPSQQEPLSSNPSTTKTKKKMETFQGSFTLYFVILIDYQVIKPNHGKTTLKYTHIINKSLLSIYSRTWK
jgi:hypothetical protein